MATVADRVIQVETYAFITHTHVSLERYHILEHVVYS